jgi:hypothetical protein
MKLTDQELAAVLAALKHWRDACQLPTTPDHVIARQLRETLAIATGGGLLEQLSMYEVGELAKRIKREGGL